MRTLHDNRFGILFLLSKKSRLFEKRNHFCKTLALNYSLPEILNTETNKKTLFNLKEKLCELSRKILFDCDKHPLLQCSPVFKKTAAYIAFEESLFDFLKNSKDAGAKSVRIGMQFYPPAQVRISVIDDGVTPIPAKKLGKYKIKEALIDRSPKSGMSNSLGGANLGLAKAAHFVQYYGDGFLELSQLSTGARVLLVSSAAPSRRSYFAECGENYVYVMIESLRQEVIKEEILNPDNVSTITKKNDEIHAHNQKIHEEMNRLLQNYHHSGCGMSIVEFYGASENENDWLVARMDPSNSCLLKRRNRSKESLGSSDTLEATVTEQVFHCK